MEWRCTHVSDESDAVRSIRGTATGKTSNCWNSIVGMDFITRKIPVNIQQLDRVICGKCVYQDLCIKIANMDEWQQLSTGSGRLTGHVTGT